MYIIIGILEQGLIYSILVLGVYITYKILNFPDLTVDGSFTSGAAITVLMISNNLSPILALIFSFFIGVLAGTITGIIHVKFKIRDLLSGIIVMTALYSINLRIAGKSNVPIFRKETIFNNSFINNIIPDWLYEYKTIIVLSLIVLFLKIIIDLYLKTKSGMLLRAVGDNEQLVTTLGKDKKKIKIFGLAISNGLVALGGSIMCQQQRFFEITLGSGAAIIGLASVIIGISILKKNKTKETTNVIIGSIIYKACISLALYVGFAASDLKLIIATLFLIILVVSEREKKQKVT